MAPGRHALAASAAGRSRRVTAFDSPGDVGRMRRGARAISDETAAKLRQIRLEISRAKLSINRVIDRLLRQSQVTRLLRYPQATFHQDRLVLPGASARPVDSGTSSVVRLIEAFKRMEGDVGIKVKHVGAAWSRGARQAPWADHYIHRSPIDSVYGVKSDHVKDEIETTLKAIGRGEVPRVLGTELANPDPIGGATMFVIELDEPLADSKATLEAVRQQLIDMQGALGYQVAQGVPFNSVAVRAQRMPWVNLDSLKIIGGRMVAVNVWYDQYFDEIGQMTSLGDVALWKAAGLPIDVERPLLDARQPFEPFGAPLKNGNGSTGAESPALPTPVTPTVPPMAPVSPLKFLSPSIWKSSCPQFR